MMLSKRSRKTRGEDEDNRTGHHLLCLEKPAFSPSSELDMSTLLLLLLLLLLFSFCLHSFTFTPHPIVRPRATHNE
ncbi:hypothetical protein F2P81_019619 [Scophthalmus maximus]|uniref:Uncharacterized protein n=1 Tax=Scophthalmus maximus TaxID=52904 RepID=A0A6A4SD69_SCOMX|nr:hypothetical protein F2P81_019619 [Scophthalmus maximus]